MFSAGMNLAALDAYRPRTAEFAIFNLAPLDPSYPAAIWPGFIHFESDSVCDSVAKTRADLVMRAEPDSDTVRTVSIR